MKQAGKDILFNLKVRKREMARFLASLRDFGLEIKYTINEECGRENRQFVVACVVSVDEIRDEKHTYIVNCFNRALERENLVLRQRYFTEGRIAVLMNTDFLHGEARLLDPTGELWDTLVEDVSNQYKTDRSCKRLQKDLLAELENKFDDEFGESACSVLVLYSHIIPCTISNHECSKLIEKFASRNDRLIIIAYDVNYQETDTERAIESLTNCENVYFCWNKTFRPYMNEEVFELEQCFKQKYSRIYSMRWTVDAENENLINDMLDTVDVSVNKSSSKFSRLYRKDKYKGKRQRFSRIERTICNKARWERKRIPTCDEI